jgi:hypothetical protein
MGRPGKGTGSPEKLEVDIWVRMSRIRIGFLGV